MGPPILHAYGSDGSYALESRYMQSESGGEGAHAERAFGSSIVAIYQP